MPIQLAMVGLVVRDMRRSLAFYRRLGLDIAADEDEKRFVMHRMPSGVTIFFDTVFFPGNDPERRPAPRGSYNVALEFYAGTREAVDDLYAELTGIGHVGRRAPWKSDGPYAAIVEDPDGNPILITAEDPSAEIPAQP
jgi:catechol 2,3-dioxygenase-like lactoylglutathione lyase family enzyme